MKKYQIILVAILISITAFGYYLRNDNYSLIPYPGESMDEYSFGWVGLSLIQTGVPIGISGISGYKNYDYRYISVNQVFKEAAGANPFSINTPWFDHPPLLGLITGGYAYSKGARVFEDVLISFIRKPMVILGSISILLLFIYLYKVFGYKEAIGGSLIMAVSPLSIIGSRTVQAENLLIPLFIASLVTLYLYIEHQKKWLLWVCAIIAGISLLAKLSGIAIVLSGIFILLYFSKSIRKALQDVSIYALVSMGFLLVFFSYGAAYDFEQFLIILGSNGERFYGIGSKAFYDLLTTTKITNVHYLTDGWFLSGWLAAVSLFMIPGRDKKEMYILAPLVCYLAVFLLFGSEPHGWYRYPFIPFLYAAIARIIVGAFRNKDYIIPAFMLLLIPIGVNISKIMSIEEFQAYSGIWKWVISGLLLFLFLINVRPSSRLNQIVVTAALLVIFMISIYSSMEYFFIITPEYWRGSN